MDYDDPPDDQGPEILVLCFCVGLLTALSIYVFWG